MCAVQVRPVTPHYQCACVYAQDSRKKVVRALMTNCMIDQNLLRSPLCQHDRVFNRLEFTHADDFIFKGLKHSILLLHLVVLHFDAPLQLMEADYREDTVLVGIGVLLQFRQEQRVVWGRRS